MQPWPGTIGLAPGTRRRAWGLLLALAIALASFMHVAHSHDANGPATSKLCAFCATFDRGGAPPPAVPFAPAFDPPPARGIAPPRKPLALAPLHSSCLARAPPSLQA